VSLARILVERARPQIAVVRDAGAPGFRDEISKGCRPEIATVSVALEPAFRPLVTANDLRSAPSRPDAVPEPPLRADDLVRLEVFGRVDESFDWSRRELLLKQLGALRYRAGIEVVGNADRQSITLLCHCQDQALIAGAIDTWLPGFELNASPAADGVIAAADWSTAVLRDYYPLPPYSHLLTQPGELRSSPLEALLVAVQRVPPPAVALYQCIFQAATPDHAWHQNVETLQDLEFELKLLCGMQSVYRHPQQAPSGDLRQMAGETATKAHNDKRMYAAAVRLAVVGAGADGMALLRNLSAFLQLFQHGGRPLAYIDENHYGHLPPAERRAMFVCGITYRPGFLVNTAELCGLAHPPPAALAERHELAFGVIDALVLPDEALCEGVPIGIYERAGRSRMVHIPAEARYRGTHLVGEPGCGKSCLLCRMVQHDIAAGYGVAVIDPHGDLARQILGLLPDDAIARTVFFCPGDPNWVPRWNPLHPVPGQDPARLATELVNVFRRCTDGWGDRLSTFLQHAFYALQHFPDSTMLDAALLLREKSPTNHPLRAELGKRLENPVAKVFWQEDFAKYRRDAIGPAQHKLSKMLLSETFDMFSQPENAVDLQRIMNGGQILVADLSKLERDTADLIGGFLLGLFYVHGLARSAQLPADRKPFMVYCDEAHRFVPDTLESLLCEPRKFNVGLTFAHQRLSQFSKRPAGALDSAGATVIFTVNQDDASHLVKRLRGKVDIDTLTNLPYLSAVVRSDGHIARITTPKWADDWSQSTYDRVVSESHSKYYTHVSDTAKAKAAPAHDPDWTYDAFA